MFKIRYKSKITGNKETGPILCKKVEDFSDPNYKYGVIKRIPMDKLEAHEHCLKCNKQWKNAKHTVVKATKKEIENVSNPYKMYAGGC